MKRSLWGVAILGLSVVACGTPSAQPTGSAAANPTGSAAANPTASSGSPASAAVTAFCTALDAHVANVTALRDFDPATSSVDQLKTAAAKARTTLNVLKAAIGPAGAIAYFADDDFPDFQGTALLDEIERLPTGATPQEVKQMLDAYAWPDPVATDQLAFYAKVRGAVCTNAPNPSAAS